MIQKRTYHSICIYLNRLCKKIPDLIVLLRFRASKPQQLQLNYANETSNRNLFAVIDEFVTVGSTKSIDGYKLIVTCQTIREKIEPNIYHSHK